MWTRTYWLAQLKAAWTQRSVVWLSGVRRTGKTVLCSMVEPAEYLDCELPSARRVLEDPESFLRSLRGKRVALDEVHRLPNPSELLKIAADHFPETQVIATGSSTLQASTRFRDTLTGRKSDVWLTPMMSADLVDFGRTDLVQRLYRGGLPPFFLSSSSPEREYQEWMDSYWAKDIQELFRLERRSSFQRFVELILTNSGGLFQATTYAAPCEISRQTVGNYLNVLEATHVAHVIRPYSTRRLREVVSAPKVYGFDTGFVCYYRGWHEPRPEDLGYLWEHLVLNELHSRLQAREAIRYWRDKQGHEVDFVLVGRGRAPTAVECKWSASGLDDRNLRSFRHLHPKGGNWIVAADVTRPFQRVQNGLTLDFIGLEELARRVPRFA
jgi:uncharacterized protein